MPTEKYKDYLYIFGAVIFLGVLGTWLLAINGLLPVLNPSPTPFSKINAQGEYIPSIPESRDILLADAPLIIPQVKKEQAISVESVPQELMVFFLSDATSRSAFYVTYANNKTGYRLVMSVPLSLLQTTESFLYLMRNNKSWKYLYGARQELFAVRQYEGLNYKVSIEQLWHEDARTYVEVQVISR